MSSSRAAEAWRLRSEEGLKWREVAERTGYSGCATAYCAAMRYARVNGIAPPVDNANERLDAAIQARIDGMSWREITERFGYSDRFHAARTVINGALSRGIVLSRVGEQGAEAYRLYPMLGTWVVVGEAMLASPSAARLNARNHARRHDLPWPPVAMQEEE